MTKKYPQIAKQLSDQTNLDTGNFTQVAITLRKEIEALEPAGVSVTVSIGLATNQQNPGLTLTQLLNRADKALYAVALTGVWQNLGLTFIITLAGLQAVPEDLHEAARLDGFGPIRSFFRVTLPLITPTMLFLSVALTVFGLQAFAQVDVLTGGGPARSTEVLVFKIFISRDPLNLAEGSVMSVGLFVVTAVVAALQFWILERRVHYAD